MRCLALAEELRNREVQCKFYCLPLSGHLMELIRARGFVVQPLESTPHNGIQSAYELRKLLESEGRAGESLNLVVDHYGIDHQWESEVRPSVNAILAIDDLADRKHDCNILLDQNYSSRTGRYRDLIPEDAVFLQGPGYALLRSEFRAVRTAHTIPGFDLRNVLIFFGGTDPDNYTSIALKLLASLGDFAPRVMVGAGHPDIPSVRKALSGFAHQELHVQSQTVPELMAQSSWYFGAGGSITWERLCMGLPGIAVPVADNQEELVHELSKGGYTLRVDLPFSAQTLSQQLDRLGKEYGALQQRGMSLVDGFGASRVSNELINVNRSIDIRPATENDLTILFQWANDSKTRENAFQSKPIPWSDHVEWFSARLKSSDSRIFIFIVDGLPAGQIRFDLKFGEWWIDYGIDRQYRGQGLAKILLKCAEAWMKATFGHLRLRAEVKAQNSASLKAFEASGYSIISVDGGVASCEKDA